MDEDDIIETHVEALDDLLAEEEEIEFFEEENPNEPDEEEPEEVPLLEPEAEEEPEEVPLLALEAIVPAIATMSVVVGGTTLNLEQAPIVLTTTSMTIFKKENRAKLTEEKRADHFT
jgi:hypothetical protein